MKFNIKKLGLFQQLGCLIIFCMMGFSVQAACDFTLSDPVTVSQTTAFSGGTQYYYLFDCDGTLIAGDNTTADFGQQAYGCYEIYAVNSCLGTAPGGITSPADITALSATDYASTATTPFTVCNTSILETQCEGEDVTVVSTPNSYDIANDMTYVLVCDIDGTNTISANPVTISAGTTPAEATFTTPVDNDATANGGPYSPSCVVYVFNHCTPLGLTNGADWATVDPSANVNVDVVSAAITFTDNNCVGLPLELLSFDASCDEGIVRLEWLTASEDNVKHMIVQRSFDGDKFTDMGVIDAKSNGLPVETTYNYIDQKPLSRGLYRLKVVDFDGSFEYSSVRQINCTKGGFDFTEIFPNPTRKDITVNFEIQNQSTNVTLKLVDVLGRIVHSEEIIPTNGLNSVNVDMSKLSPAVYTVVLDDGTSQITQRIVKD